MDKCPFPHHQSSLSGGYSQAIAGIFRQLKEGVDIIVDTPEKEQAVFAYRIYQFGSDLTKFSMYMDGIVQTMEDEPGTYKDMSKEIGKFLENYGMSFFGKLESDSTRKSKLVAGLETFHAFVKRAVLFAKVDNTGRRMFPYVEAQQLASTAMERGNMMIDNPDYDGWGGLFFDPNIDVSKLFLGVPISRPIYKCPVLYTGKFRDITDAYFQIMCHIHDISVDRPKVVDWNDSKKVTY